MMARVGGGKSERWVVFIYAGWDISYLGSEGDRWGTQLREKVWVEIGARVENGKGKVAVRW